VAAEWAQTFDQATRPHQFARQARAGRDALAACACAVLSIRPDAVLVSLAGGSAYDSMSRTAFLTNLRGGTRRQAEQSPFEHVLTV